MTTFEMQTAGRIAMAIKTTFDNEACMPTVDDDGKRQISSVLKRAAHIVASRADGG